jgi:hypothetical protein
MVFESPTLEKNIPKEGFMPRKKEPGICMSGGQLIAAGDLIRVMDQGSLVQCRVLSCLATEDGACLASLEILEGDRKGEKISATLRASDEADGKPV